MTSVTVTLQSGAVRSFNTAYTAQHSVEATALNSGLLAGTSLQQRSELAKTLADVYSGAVDNVELSSETLAAAGIAKVQVGQRTAAPENVPATDDTPVYAALQAENSDDNYLSGADDDESEEWPEPAAQRVSRKLAALVAGATLVVGIVAGALIW